MIHYFNPGHETAVLNASEYYHPPAHVTKMQTDLAFLPAWYASDGDFVFTLDDEAASKVCFSVIARAIAQINPSKINDIDCFASLAMTRCRFSGQTSVQNSVVDLWGISPQSIRFFENLNERLKLSLVIPRWKEEFLFLGSRFASQKVLTELLDRIPEIEKELLPQFFSDIEDIEKEISQSQERLLVKSPYSSSGRGLVWLPPGKLAQSERQILGGMLKKQKQVSVEKALNKFMDFSMHFEITEQGETGFSGYSIFQTNGKGAYEKSRLAGQGYLEKQITGLIDAGLLLQTRNALSEIIREMYSPYYTGVIGVDMLIYKTGDSYRLYPCVEINMRKSMGYLAIRLVEKYLHPDSQGEFSIDYNRDSQATVQKHKQLQKQYPLIIENGRIRSGYLSLCPVTDSTNYQAFVIIHNS
jgi:hypothetical protein